MRTRDGRLEPLKWVGKVPWDKRAFNLPYLVLKARHLSGSAFGSAYKQALGGIPLSFGLLQKINLLDI